MHCNHLLCKHIQSHSTTQMWRINYLNLFCWTETCVTIISTHLSYHEHKQAVVFSMLEKPFLHSTSKQYFFGILIAWDCMWTLSRTLGCCQGLLHLTKLDKTYYLCYLSCLFILFCSLRAYGRNRKELYACILRSSVRDVEHTTQSFELMLDYYVIATTLLLLFINLFVFFIIDNICCFVFEFIFFIHLGWEASKQSCTTAGTNFSSSAKHQFTHKHITPAPVWLKVLND